MTGMSFYHDHMDLPFPGILHTGAPHHYWGAEPGETEEAFSRRRAAELEEMIVREGPETIGAFIAEPVLGTGGITPRRMVTGVKFKPCLGATTFC